MTEERIPLLQVEDLSLEFRTRTGTVRALERVSFEVHKGETLGVVGESGSGKSVMSYAIMGILDPSAAVTSGRILFGGIDLLEKAESELQEMRGREMAMIFQNPRASLNPIRAAGRQIEDVLYRHGNLRGDKLRERAVELLRQVRIPDPERRFHAYPFELSGGMCQRVLIAMAIASAPWLLIADEPVTGLDVTTQAVIMDLIDDLARTNHMATILITHDLGLAAEHCGRIAVMHAGHVVEVAETGRLFRSPRHPYTAKLIAATPRPDEGLAALAAIPGGLPDLRAKLPPCRYSARCERYARACDLGPLPAREFSPGHRVACWNPIG
ncbi:MAG: ABC transporter ATP-binding protein [Nitrospinota bacterium]